MTGDTLKFRMPGSDPVYRTGRFVLSEGLQSNGFIVTSFLKDAIYRFVEEELEPGIYYRTNSYSDYSKEHYLQAGQQLLREFAKGDIRKAVLSRPLNVRLSKSPFEIFDKLCSLYPNAFVYLISSPLFGTWIGASPELLLKSEGYNKETVALAGTKKNNDTSPWSPKERMEHQYVVDHIDNTVSGLTLQSSNIKEPFEVIAGPVKHLKTEFQFKSSDNDVAIIDALHPTPAIAGTPVGKSVIWIKENEGYDRQLYTGMIGQLGNSSNMFVNLRCMQLFENECTLYLGGGWTIESDPDKEWNETENKALTLLQVLEMK